MSRLCSIPDCTSPHNAKGLCMKHYRRARLYGDPLVAMKRDRLSLDESVRPDGDCLIWTGEIDSRGGYGRIVIKGKAYSAHRYAYEQARGPVAPEMRVDHICHNRACVNVAHLRLATHAQNLANRKGARAGNSTGFRNVYRAGEKFMVQIRKLGALHHLGTFEALEEAVEVARVGRERLFGEFAGNG